MAMSLFCGATGTLCFGLRLTPPMSFKAKVDAPFPTLYVFLCVMDPRCQLWFPKKRPGPNFSPWYGEATARVITQCHFQDCWQIQSHDLTAQSLTLYRLNYVRPGKRYLPIDFLGGSQILLHRAGFFARHGGTAQPSSYEDTELAQNWQLWVLVSIWEVLLERKCQ